jgi:hypothetical protein
MTSADDLSDWAAELDRIPAGIRMVAAVQAGELRGRRAVIGLPGIGWRHELRADSTVVQASRTFVPVLSEQEWYRAETEQIEVFAPLVPLERVWIEQVGLESARTSTGLSDRLVSLDAPPDRVPYPARDIVGLTGRRVVLVPSPDEKAAGDRRDLRAVTEPYANVQGDICVRVVTELDWYRWGWSGQSPRALEVPIHLLWVE